MNTLNRHLRSLLVAAVTLPAGLAPAVRADPTPAKAALGPAVARDWHRTLEAREGLRREPALRGVNLGVTVKGDTLTLWGPAPTPEVAQAAESCARQLPGVARVVNELTVLGGGEPRVASPAATTPRLVSADPAPLVTAPPLPSPAPTRSYSARVATPGPAEPALPRAGLLTPLEQPRRPWRSGLFRGVSASPRDPAPAVPPKPVVAEKPSPEPPPAPGPVIVAEPAGDLAGEVERLRQSDARYRGIFAEVRDGVVYLSGRGSGPADLFELAEKVRGLGLPELRGVRLVTR